jgi:alkanesulfonate monooxygenase SsuD/methylene tetrahydromethanopterin reductase-like flavin-dependent oxidoreductase (luciferase family)
LKLGITLPTFESSADAALTVVCEAEEAGVDGVFAFDHLWPGIDKARPALSMYPVLGAAAALTRRIGIGSLVARLGLVPDRVVVESLVSLHELAGPRLVAALGIGDSKSLAENEAFGIAFPALESRRLSLVAILGELTARGIEAWVGAVSPATLDIARSAGATVNLWDLGLDRVRAEAARGPTTWAGPLPASAKPAAHRLVELRDAGATWAVWGWPRSIGLVVQAMEMAGIGDDRD